MYLKEWKQKHPDYQRRWRERRNGERSSDEIKAEIPLQTLPIGAKTASFPLQAVRYKPRGVSKGIGIAELERGYRLR